MLGDREGKIQEKHLVLAFEKVQILVGELIHTHLKCKTMYKAAFKCILLEWKWEPTNPEGYRT